METFHPWSLLWTFRLSPSCVQWTWKVSSLLTNESSYIAMITGLQSCVWSGPKMWHLHSFPTLWLLTYSPPTLTGVGHQWTVSTNTGCNQWLSLAKPTLKMPLADRNHSLVARTNKCGWAIIVSSQRHGRLLTYSTKWCCHLSSAQRMQRLKVIYSGTIGLWPIIAMEDMQSWMNQWLGQKNLSTVDYHLPTSRLTNNAWVELMTTLNIIFSVTSYLELCNIITNCFFFCLFLLNILNFFTYGQIGWEY
jgi:hypothetical protein